MRVGVIGLLSVLLIPMAGSAEPFVWPPEPSHPFGGKSFRPPAKSVPGGCALRSTSARQFPGRKERVLRLKGWIPQSVIFLQS
jgi:hypothetical protein